MHGRRSHSVQIRCQVGKALFYLMLSAINNERPGYSVNGGHTTARRAEEAESYPGTADRMNSTIESSEEPG